MTGEIVPPGESLTESGGEGNGMTIELYRGDLPAGLKLGPIVAVDTETMGLVTPRDSGH